MSEVIGEEQNLNNPVDWQFGWATYSAITGIGSSVGQPVHQFYIFSNIFNSAINNHHARMLVSSCFHLPVHL